MRFYKNILPSKGDIVIVSIINNDFDGGFIKVNLLEYDNMEGNIIHTNISKKVKIVNKFVKTKKNKSFPCYIHEIDGSIPSLIIINDQKDHDEAIRKYELFKEVYSITEDYIFMNKHIDRELFYTNFMWIFTEEKNKKNENYSFDEFLENPEKLKKYMNFDQEIVDMLISQFTDRIEYSNIIYTTDINITILSDNSLFHLNTLINNISEYCNSIYYNGAPHYKLTFKDQTEELCKNKLNLTLEYLKKYCTENDIKSIIKIIPDSSKIQIRTIKLSNIGRKRV